MTRITTDIGEVVLDAAVSRAYQGDVEVTEHPVESGVNIVDHARPKAETIQITGEITDTPVPKVARDDLGNSAIEDRVRADDAVRLLRRIKDESVICTVTDSRIALTNLLLTSMQDLRDPRSGSAVQVMLAFKKVSTVSTKTVAVVQRVNAKKNLNKLAPKKTDDATAKRSLLKRGTDAIGLTAPGSGTEAGQETLKRFGLRQ